MAEDKIEIEILDDGTIKVTTDKISQPNHVGADKLLQTIQQLTGGPMTKTKRKGEHTHGRGHTHTHN